MEFQTTLKTSCYAIGVLAVLVGVFCGLAAIWTQGLNELLFKTFLSAVVVFGGAVGILVVSSYFGPKPPKDPVEIPKEQS